MFPKTLVICVILLHILPVLYADECSCKCRGRKYQSVCDNIDQLWKIADTNTGKLIEWERYRPFVERFSERWKKEISDIVESKIQEYMLEKRILPKPENLISPNENEIEDDSMIISKPHDDESNLVSNLLAKVEMVENRTIEVEEELKSERRVRRHLEQEVKETQTSLIFLGDRLNSTVPVDAMMDQVQTVIYSSFEDMNRTLYEDHLKKLYYKVDGVAYKNETKDLIERLEHVETELRDSDNSSIVFKFIEDLQTIKKNLYHLNSSVESTLMPLIEALNNSVESILVPRLEMLETEVIRKDTVEELEENMITLLNNTELLFKSALTDVWSDIKNIQKFEEKFQNFSEEWAKSLDVLQNQIEHLKNESIRSRPAQLPDDLDDMNDILQVQLNNSLTENDVKGSEEYWEPEVIPKIVNRSRLQDETSTPDYEDIVIIDSDFTPDVVDRTRIGKVNEEDNETCEKPIINDTHLLADVVVDSSGRSNLKIGCRPIGEYVVSHLPVPPRCEMGSWKEPFPSCKKLFTMSEIEYLAGELLKEQPCSSGFGEFQDPVNCSQFIKCSHGTAVILVCPSGLIYNTKLGVCDYPRKTPCDLTPSENVKELQNLIPPIYIEPNILDKPNSHMGTGTAGELIVHPRSSFTLHCIYPENIWGLPVWNVTYTSEEENSRELILKEGENRISLTVTAAQEEDSGIYKCVTSFGIQHAIEVLVKVVICPAFKIEDEYEDVFYRPTPEGELRIMGTTAEFPCEDGRTIITQCMADGKWSRDIPTENECSLKKRNSDNLWNCKPFDLSGHPDLILEKNDHEKVITFKCAGGKRLIGNSFTRCRDDGYWSHVSLPRCKD